MWSPVCSKFVIGCIKIVKNNETERRKWVNITSPHIKSFEKVSFQRNIQKFTARLDYEHILWNNKNENREKKL